MRKPPDFSLVMKRCNNSPGETNEKTSVFLISSRWDVTISGETNEKKVLNVNQDRAMMRRCPSFTSWESVISSMPASRWVQG